MSLWHLDHEPAAVAAGVIGRDDAEVAVAEAGAGRALDRARRVRREAGPAAVARGVFELHGEAQAVARDRVRDAVLDLVVARHLGQILPAVAGAVRFGVFTRERDPLVLPRAGCFPDHREVAAGRTRFRFTVGFGRRTFVRRDVIRSGVGRQIFVATAGRIVRTVRIAGTTADEQIAAGNTVGIGRTVTDLTLHARHHAAIHFDDRTGVEVEQQVGVPVGNRHGRAVAHQVDGGPGRLLDQAAVAEDSEVRFDRVVIQVHARGAGALQIVVGAGHDSVGLEHRLPAGGTDLVAALVRLLDRIEQQPDRALFVHGHDAGRAVDFVADPEAIELALGDQAHVFEAVAAAPERLLVQERPSHAALEQVDGALARGHHQRAVRVPLGRGQERFVDVTAREIAVHFAGEVAVGTAARDVDRVDGQAFDRFAPGGVFRRLAIVTTQVQMITGRVAGGALEPDQLTSRHFFPIADEGIVQVTEQHVGAVALIDVDVHPETAIAIAVVHVGRAADGREDRVVLAVGRVQIDIEQRRFVAVAVAAAGALNAASLVARLEREGDGDGVLAATRAERLHEIAIARAAARRGREEHQTGEPQGDEERDAGQVDAAEHVGSFEVPIRNWINHLDSGGNR